MRTMRDFAMKQMFGSSKCEHPNYFFKEFKFYCRTCGDEEERPEWDWLKKK